jgi:hypothetical protein
MAAAVPDLVGRARAAYNRGDYDGAIDAARAARVAPGATDSAAVVLARAHLERFRHSADREDLQAARTALLSVHPARLAPRERTEFLLGLAESTFFDDDFGAAADLFESALGKAADLGYATRQRVLDWWASAVERQAVTAVPDERVRGYRLVVERMVTELQQDPTSAVGAYWMAAGARGAGDLDGAWQAAVAGWVRAPLTGERAVTLRADLDRLVREGVIPDRVRRMGVADRERDAATATLRTEWERVKQRWTRGPL